MMLLNVAHCILLALDEGTPVKLLPLLDLSAATDKNDRD